MNNIAKMIAKFLAVNAITSAHQCGFIVTEERIHDMLSANGVDCDIDEEMIEKIEEIYWWFDIDLGGFEFYKENGEWVFDLNPGLDYLPHGCGDEFWELDGDTRSDEERYIDLCENAIEKLSEIALYE